MGIQVVLAAWGSSGDVLPLISIGAELRRRGNSVVFVGNPYFAGAVRAASLSMSEVGTVADHHRLMADTEIFSTVRKSMEAVYSDHYYPHLDAYFTAVEKSIEPGSTVIVGRETAAAAIAHRDRIPCVHAIPSSVRFFSRYDPPHPEKHFPVWMRRVAAHPLGLTLFYRAHHLRHGLIGWPSTTQRLGAGHPLARIRARAGLALQRQLPPDLVLCLWPAWFSPPQRDWPPNAVNVGFPLDYKVGTSHRQESKPANEVIRPIVATTGSLAASQSDFYSKVVAACEQLQRPAILVTPHADHIPKSLPRGIVHVAHAPFRDLFLDASLVIHHGGIGTGACALAAGVPQIAMPMRGDQFDNANRMARLGVASVLAAETTGAARLARAITVMSSARVGRRCRHWQVQVSSHDGPSCAADRVEELIIGRAEREGGSRTHFTGKRKFRSGSLVAPGPAVSMQPETK